MNNIYLYNEYDRTNILNTHSLLQEQLLEEQNKSKDEINKEKVFQIIYKQFINGLKLSNRNKLF